MASQLAQYLHANGLGEIFQSAYTQGCSTETTLLQIQNDILMSLDKQQAVCLVLLDISSAFDTIDHDILLMILENVEMA